MQRGQRLGLFDLGQHPGAALHDLLELGHVFGPLHEAERDPVHPQRQRRVQISAVLGCHGRERQQGVGHVDALAVLDLARHFHDRFGKGIGLAQQAQAHLAIIDQQGVLLLDRLEDLGMRNRHLFGLVAGLAQHQAYALAFGQHARAAGQFAQPDFGALQVAKDADGPSHVFGQLAQVGMHLGQHLMAGVAHIDAKDIHSGLEELAHLLQRVGGGAQGGEDLGLAAAAHQELD